MNETNNRNFSQKYKGTKAFNETSQKFQQYLEKSRHPLRI